MTKYMYFLPLKISSLFFLSRPQHHRLNVLVSRSSSSGASRTCVVPINTGSSPHPAESATVLGGRRPGASARHIRRVTRNSCERTTRKNTKLQRRSALLRPVSHTSGDINTTVKSKELAYGTCTHWHTSRNQHVNICTHARHEQQHRLCVW